MNRTIWTSLAVAPWAHVAGATPPCQGEWRETFPAAQMLYGQEQCLEVFTVNGQTRLYSGTGYWDAIRRPKSWTGKAWEEVDPSDTLIGALAMVEFDDGTGPTIYTGSLYALRDGKWQKAFDPSDTVFTTLALAPWQGGPNHGLYFGGRLLPTDKGNPYVGRWDGADWQIIGDLGYVPSGVPQEVRALRWYDDGFGPALYAGGRFDSAGGQPAVSIARWNGTEWSPVGEALTGGGLGFPPYVNCLAVHPDPESPGGHSLFVGGHFAGAGQLESGGVLKWDGQAWHALGGGLRIFFLGKLAAASVYALEWFDDGDGEKLYAGGHITETIDGRQANFIARFDGTKWEPVGGGMKGRVRALRAFDDGRGPALWVGSESLFADGQGDWDGGKFINSHDWKLTGCVARYDRSGWRRPVVGGAEEPVRAAFVREEEGRQVLYAFGAFLGIGDIRQHGIGRFDGESWTPVGDWRDLGDLDYDGGWWAEQVTALTTIPGDSALYAAVSVPVKDKTQPHHGVARFDGEHWSWIGVWPDEVFFLGAIDHGSGPALYATTYLASPGQVGGIHRFDGQKWEQIASYAMTNFGSGLVWSMGMIDDGSGPALWAWGFFDEINGAQASGVARFDGQAWHPVGDAKFSKLDGNGLAQVRSVARFDSVDGPRVYVGGTFNGLNGKPCTLAAWDGHAWEVVSKDPGGFAFARVMDLGDGPALYVGGWFDSIAGHPARQLARLTADGQWQGMDPTGIGFWYQKDRGFVSDAALFDDPFRGRSLVVSGGFEFAGGLSAGNIAHLVLCPKPPCPADLDGSGTLDLFDFLTFLNLFHAGDAAADCDGDGQFTLGDFACYAGLFTQGCP